MGVKLIEKFSYKYFFGQTAYLFVKKRIIRNYIVVVIFLTFKDISNNTKYSLILEMENGCYQKIIFLQL
jgi:hypothetical protein